MEGRWATCARKRPLLVTSPVAHGHDFGKSAVISKVRCLWQLSTRLLSAGYVSVQTGLHPFLAYFPYYEIIKAELWNHLERWHLGYNLRWPRALRPLMGLLCAWCHLALYVSLCVLCPTTFWHLNRTLWNGICVSCHLRTSQRCNSRIPSISNISTEASLIVLLYSLIHTCILTSFSSFCCMQYTN
jgi:hypothetical protein